MNYYPLVKRSRTADDRKNETTDALGVAEGHNQKA